MDNRVPRILRTAAIAAFALALIGGLSLLVGAASWAELGTKFRALPETTQYVVIAVVVVPAAILYVRYNWRYVFRRGSKYRP